MDSAAVNAATRDHWITASGQALTPRGRCDIHLQVPPITGTAKVTFEVVDVHYPILSVAGLVAEGPSRDNTRS